MSGGATITMTCLVCDDMIRTSEVDKALAFDKEHREMHPAPADHGPEDTAPTDGETAQGCTR